MQIWVIYGILLVIECCGTLGTAVNEAYFALFSMGAHGTGMTPDTCKLFQDMALKVFHSWKVMEMLNVGPFEVQETLSNRLKMFVTTL